MVLGRGGPSFGKVVALRTSKFMHFPKSVHSIDRGFETRFHSSLPARVVLGMFPAPVCRNRSGPNDTREAGETSDADASRHHLLLPGRR